MSALRRRLGWVLRVLLWCGLCVAALVGSALAHLDMRIGRKVMAAWIGDVVSPAMSGDLSVGRIQRISLDGVVLRRVELFDAQGRRVAHGGRLVLVLDTDALRGLRVRFRRALLTDATVWLFDKGDGLPTFIDCFDAPPGTPSSGGAPLEVEVDGIEIERVRLVGDLLGLQGMVAEGVKAGGKLEIGKYVNVRIDRATGSLLEPFGFPARIDALRGTISTQAERGVHLFAEGHRVPTQADISSPFDRSREQARAEIRYAALSGAPDSPSELHLSVDARELRADTLQGLGFDWMPELKAPVSGHFGLRGPIENFGFDAALATPAGPAELRGRTDITGTSVTVTTSGLQLDQVLDGAPGVRAEGLLRIDVTHAEPYPRLHAEVQPLLYQRFAIPGFDFDGAITDRGLRIDSLDARSEGARLEGHGTVDRDGAFDVQVRAHFADIGRDTNLRRLVPNASGSLDADVSVTTSGLAGDVLRADGVISMGNLRYESVKAKRLTLRGRVRGSADHPAAQLQVSGLGLIVGDYLLGDPKLTVSGGPRVFKAQGQFITEGRRTFDMQAQLTLERDAVVIVADPIEVVIGIPGANPADAASTANSWRGALTGLRVSEHGVELEQLRLANRSQRLEAHGKVRFEGADELQAQLQDFDLAVVHALVGDEFPIERGRADTSVSLSGELTQPVLRVQGALREGAAMGIDQINAVYLVEYVGGALQADGEIDLGERGVVQLSGTGQLDPREPDPVRALRYGSYDLEIGSQGLTLALIPQAAQRNIRGQLSGQVRLHGPLDLPSVGGRIELVDLQVPGWAKLDVSADGRYADGQLAATFALADGAGPIMTAGGRMDFDLQALRDGSEAPAQVLLRGPWQISGQSTARRLDRMPEPLAQQLPYPISLATRFDLRKQDGVTSGQLSFDGSWVEELHDAECAQAAKPRLRGTVSLAGTRSTVSFNVLAGPWQIGTFQAAVETPFERWLQLGRVEQPTLAQASGRISVQAMQRVPYLCRFGDGSLDGALELDRSGDAEPLLVAQLSSKLSPRNVQHDGRRDVQVLSCEGDPLQLNVDLTANRKALALDGQLTGCHGAATELEANLPVEWDSLFIAPLIDPLRNAEATARFAGAQLKPLLEGIPGVSEADARAHGEVHLHGPLADPKISGQVAVSGGQFYLVSTGQLWTDLEAGFDFRDNWIKVTHFNARQGAGTFEASGGIGLKGIWPDRAQLGLRAERVPIKQEGVDLGWLSGSIAVDAEMDSERTRAVLKVHELLVRLPNTSNRTLQALEPHPDVKLTTAGPKRPPSEYLVEFMLDSDRRITVRRNDFETNVSTKVVVRYNQPELAVGGTISFNGGEFEVFGKRFTINGGSLRFDGTNDINPDVFLAATQRPEGSGKSPVTVSVTGTLAEPEVTFASDACPGDSGAITYLIAGVCASDDPDLAQGAEDAEAAFANGVASGVLTLGAQNELSGLMPRIAVQSNRRGGSSVSAGFTSTALVPKFLRPLVNRVYIQGGVARSNEVQGSTGEQQPAATTSTSLEFLMELYFPHDLVGAGHFGETSWGLDVTWEP